MALEECTTPLEKVSLTKDKQCWSQEAHKILEVISFITGAKSSYSGVE